MVDNEQTEQVAGESSLCDIIAQQREFQARHEERARNKAPQQQQQAVEWRDSSESAEWQPPVAGKQRRKFSLSYAMSNLTGLASADKPASGDKPERPARRLQHRASLMPGQL